MRLAHPKITTPRFFFTMILSLALFLPRIEAVAETKQSFIPRFSTYARYDTNFYLVDETFGKEREVYTYVLEPGIGYVIESPKSKLILNYSAPIHFYDDKSDVPAGEHSADDDNYIGHILNFLNSLKFWTVMRLGAMHQQCAFCSLT